MPRKVNIRGMSRHQRRLPMPKFGIKITGVRQFERNIKRVIKNTESATYKAVEKCCNILATEAMKICVNIAYDTGKLANSMRGMVIAYSIDVVIGQAGSFGVEYALYVHEGTKYMVPRPFLLIAIKNKKDRITRIIHKAYRKDIAKGIKLL